MTKAKRLVAILLAFIMAFSAVSVTSFAVDEGNLTVVSKIGQYNSDGTVWTEVNEVKKGDDVTVRVFLDSDFYSTVASLMFFYNIDFFTDSYGGSDTLRMGSLYYGAPYHYTATINANTARLETIMVATNQITQEQADDYKALQIGVNSSSAQAAKYDGDTYFVEVNLKVLDNPSTDTGNFILIPGTVASTSNQRGFFYVNKGAEGADAANCDSCFLWNLNLTHDDADDQVTLYNTYVEATFDANGGDWSEDVVLKGSAGSAIAETPVPKRQGYTFLGWAEADDAEDGEEVTEFPSFSTTYYAVWESAVPEGETLSIITKFFRNVGTESAPQWEETTRVKPGEAVKARVYLASDYATNSGTLLFFYDNTFFSDDYAAEGALTLNDKAESFTGSNTVTGWYGNTLGDSRAVAEQVTAGNLDEAFLAANNYFVIGFSVKGNNVKLYDDAAKNAIDGEVDNDYWFCEFDMTVAKDAEDEGDLFIVDATTATPSNIRGINNVPKGFEDTNENNGMWLWNANVVADAQAVSVNSTVTYDFEGGKATVSSTEYNDSYTVTDVIDSDLPTVSDPTKTGYVFDYWYEEGDEAQAKVTPAAKMPYDDTTYVAKWVEEVTVTFSDCNGNEQTFTGGAGFDFDGTVTTPTAPSGKQFMGWSLIDGGDTGALPLAELPTEFPAEDVTYYAVWDDAEPKTATFWLVREGKADTLLATMPLAEGATVPTNFAEFLDIPGGYVADGWYKDNTCKEKYAADTKMPGADTSFYAKLVLADLTATFKANGGKFADDTEEKTVTAKYLATFNPPADPTRDGFDFLGWKTNGMVADTFVMDNENGITYVAAWEEHTYTVTYYTDDTTVYETFDGLYEGEEIDYPADPAKPGYEFMGWDVDGDKIADDLNEVIMPKDDLDIYALWEAVHNIKVKWDANGGQFADDSTSKTDAATYDFDDTVTAYTEEPARADYEFVGWASADDATEEDAVLKVDSYVESAEEGKLVRTKTFYAVWEAISQATYTVETYEMGTDGTYPATPKSSTTSEMVAVGTDIDISDDANKGVATGFELDADNSVLTGKVATTGLTLKVYYKRESHTVTYMLDDAQYGDVDTYLYGQAVTARALPSKAGYTYTAWDPAVPSVMGTDDVVVYTTTTVTATWNAGEGKWGTETTKTTTGAKGSDIEKPADPTAPEGYAFKGWKQNGTAVTDFGKYGDNVTYTAEYTANNYTATFNANTGVFATGAVTTKDVAYGSAITADGITEPTKEGYTFQGWNLDQGAEVAGALGNMDSIKGKTVYAIWKINSYTATWNTGVGAWGTETTKETNGNYGDAITAPEAPTAPTGKIFKGWSKTDGGAIVDDFGTFGANETYYAVYDDIIYKATWNAGDGDWSGNKSQDTTGTYNTAITAPTNPTAPEGYSFTGWAATAGGDVLGDLGKFTENTAFYAVYTVDSYTANFWLVVSGASPKLLASMGIEYNAVIPTNFADFLDIPEGYEIDGWYKTQACTEKYADGATMPAATTDFYAKMDLASLNAVFDANGGKFDDDTEKKTVTAKYLAEITDVPADPKKDGYKFIGWQKDGLIVDAFVMDNEKGITYVAAWDELTYTVTFTVDGKEYAKFDDIRKGEEIDIPDDPQKFGYDFTGWDVDGDGKADDLTTLVMGDKDLIVTALWDEIKVPIRVKWDANNGKFADEATVKTDAATYDFNDTVTAITDEPTREGYDFLGWAAAADATAKDAALKVTDYVESAEEGKLVRTKTFYAVWAAQTKAILTYDTWVRDADETSSTYGQLISKQNIDTFTDVNVGDALPKPSAEPTLDYYKFVGWDINNDGKADTLPDTVPADGFNAVAVFEREAVYLIPVERSTTVIDRGEGYYSSEYYTGKVRKNGTVNEYSETAYTPWSATTSNVWYVYGLTDRVSETDIRNLFCDVAGDGYYTVTPAYIPSVTTTYNPVGTGSVIKVFDKVTGEQVEEFVIVIFGDVNGDADFTSTDISALEDEAVSRDWLNSAADSAKMMAGDVNSSFIINSTDISAEEDLVVWALEYDQATGEAS